MPNETSNAIATSASLRYNWSSIYSDSVSNLEENTPIAIEPKSKKKQKTLEQQIEENIPKKWRLIKDGEIFKYPCKKLINLYMPESGWDNINVLGVDKLGKPFRSSWGIYIIPIK